MTLKASGSIDWIADREQLLIAAWAPEIEASLSWAPPFAEAFAGELFMHALSTMLNRGTGVDFLAAVARSNTGLDADTEKSVADHFFDVTLKLARAACRRESERSVSHVFPYRRACVVDDGRENPGHVPLAGILLRCDHPFWSRWYPPLDMDCRCSTILVTRSQFERLGGRQTSDQELAEREGRLSGDWPKAFAPLLEFRTGY